MIQFDRVALGFGDQTLYEDVSFTLQRGERCALVGKNGSGKSTLFRIIDGTITPDKGSIALPKNYRIGYLQQHIHFTKPTLVEEVALGLPPGEEEMIYKAEAILFGLGFSESDLEKNPADFSGGFQLRINLAKVLVSEPQCLLLDEPTNYLDIPSIQWLQDCLSSWPGELILISHDREFLDAVSTHTMGLHRGKVRKYKGGTLAYYEQILQEEEIHEKTRLKVEKKRAHAEKFVERFGAKATKAAQAQSRVKMLERVPVLEKLSQIASLDFSFREAPFPGKKMIEAKELFFSYTDTPLIEEVSLSIEKGERIAFIGKNGRGKSTLLRLLANDLTPKSGTSHPSDNLRIGYFGQTHIERLHPSHTIEEEISLANPNLSYTEVKAIAGVMMFSGDLSLKKIHLLSGGEKSRVLLGKILARPCNFLLLDEPTHHLDIESVEALIHAIEEFEGAVILVTHSELILRRMCPNKIIVCKEATQEVFLGNYDEFLEQVGWETEEKKESPVKNKPPVRPKTPSPSSNKVFVELEKKLQELEQKQQKNIALLEKEGQNVRDLSKEIGETQTQIDALYSELEKML
jgi:ATP-binding cassette subfamily F protein 3